MIAVFAYDTNLLNTFWSYFGLQRGADLLVYTSIIALLYLYIGLINKQIKLHIDQTEIFRYLAIRDRTWDLYPTTSIALVMPCYKNHATQEFLVRILKSWYGVVFIDDGHNSHELLQFIKKLTTQHNIILISHPHNLGQGAALQTGQEYIAKHTNVPFVVHFDSDWQHDINDVANFYQTFQDNPSLDIVLGSRFLSIHNDIPRWRRRHKKLQILFSKIVTWLSLSDTHNGLRMVRREALDDLQITLNDYTHASEIESLIKTKKLKRKEVPMHVIYEEHHIKGWQPLSNAFSIARNILYRLFFFR